MSYRTSLSQPLFTPLILHFDCPEPSSVLYSLLLTPSPTTVHTGVLKTKRVTLSTISSVRSSIPRIFYRYKPHLLYKTCTIQTPLKLFRFISMTHLLRHLFESSPLHLNFDSELRTYTYSNLSVYLISLFSSTEF